MSRAAVIFSVLAVAVTLGVLTLRSPSDHPVVIQIPPPQPSTPLVIQTNTSNTPPKVEIQWIKSDPTLLQRLAIPPGKPSWIVIEDGELLRRLAEAGKPAGIAYVDGRPIVLFRETAGH